MIKTRNFPSEVFIEMTLHKILLNTDNNLWRVFHFKVDETYIFGMYTEQLVPYESVNFIALWV